MRRTEILLMLLSTAIMALGLWLVCLNHGHDPLRVMRVLTVAGSFLTAALLMRVNGEQRDHLLLPAVSLIAGIGVVFLWRLDPDMASRQIIWIMLGSALMIIVYYLIDDVRDLANYKYIAGLGAVALMVLTMAIGEERGGAQLWVRVPWFWPVSVQPGEFAKVLICIFLAGYVADKGELIRGVASDPGFFGSLALRYMGPLIAVVLFSLALFVGLNDLGAALLFFGLFVAVSYLATGRRRYPALMSVLFATGAVGAYSFFPHVARRMAAWLAPAGDPTGAGFQILQVLYGLAAGGLSGTGFGKGFPDALPAAETDAILAVVGEEIGLLGAAALMMLFVLVSHRMFSIAWQCVDSFGAMLAASLGTVFALQTLVIVGGLLRIIPLTGVTLPFVSYGGTSIVVNFVALGLVLAVSRDCRPPLARESEARAA